VPEIYAYSISSVIFEKFEAIVSLGDANSRYKDFYDIYILADRYDLDGTELKEAVKETFDHRGTGFGDIFASRNDFITSKDETGAVLPDADGLFLQEDYHHERCTCTVLQ